MMYLFKKLFPAIVIGSLVTAGAATAQTISIVSGDGAIVTQNNVTLNNLVVVVRGAQGQPQAGATVTWTVNGQGSVTNGATTTTAADGTSTNSFLGPTLFNLSYAQAVVNASAFGSSVNFTMTTSGLDLTASQAALVQAVVTYPTAGAVLTGSAGSVGSTAVQVQVFSNGISGFSGLQNVLVRLIPANTTGPQITCSGSTGYTTSNGYASCLPVFSGSPGSGNYTIDVGEGYRQYGPFPFTVSQGSVAGIIITGGNNQAGAPGTALTLPLSARTQDVNGNPLPSVPVTWLVSPPGAATLIGASTASDQNGNVSAQVTLGPTPGPVQVVLSSSQGGTVATFSLSVNVQITGINKLAGDTQTALVNSTFAQPLVVQVASAQGPASNVQVRFTSTGAPVSFSNGGIATTDATGKATVTVQSGGTAGTATVTASLSSFVATFTLTIRPPGPQITSSSFSNGVGGQAGGVSPSSVLTIAGAGIAPGLQGCISGNQFIGPLPLLVSNVTVLFSQDSYQAYAPIFAVCNLGVGQEYVTVQVPTDLALGAATVIVAANSGSTTLNNIPVTPVSPGIFQTAGTDNVMRAVLQHASDGSYVTLQSPAHAGEKLRAYVTGLGRPISASGVRIGTDQGGIPGDDASPQTQVILGVADEGVTPDSVIYAQNQIGVWVLTFEVPTDAPSGNSLNFAVSAILNDTPNYGNASKIPIQ